MANDDDKSSLSEVFMITAAACPVLGAMISAPIVGSSLAGMALFDSLLILVRGY